MVFSCAFGSNPIRHPGGSLRQIGARSFSETAAASSRVQYKHSTGPQLWSRRMGLWVETTLCKSVLPDVREISIH